MIRTILISVLAVLLANPSWASERVGDFALLDQSGIFHRMSYYDNYKAIAFLVQTNDSKATATAIVEFNKLEKANENVKFFLINPTATESRASVQLSLNKYGTDIPVLMDDTQVVSDALGISHSGEVFLFDPQRANVIFRGPVASLGQAIAQFSDGNEVSPSQVAMSGKADVVYADKVAAENVSYEKDVAPILAENCARCHREGGVGPFAMNSHTMVRGFAPMIREVVMNKRMPPGQIDPHVGDFEQTYTLTPDQTRKLVGWIDAGAKKDGATDPLTQLTWPTTKWAYGEPDLIIKVPPQDIPATGVLDYINVVVPIEGLDRDRWVKASQYVAGDRTVLHHTLNRVIGPDEGPRRGGFVGGGNPDEPGIQPYVPGGDPFHEEPNTGGLLKKGSQIALQLHYTTMGKATTDASEIGVWFYDDDEVPQERMLGDCACIFTRGWQKIPPFEANHQMSRTITFTKDSYLYSFLPHMHFRGKSMRFNAEYPDGRKEELLNIAEYNYNWQLFYQLKEPVFMPEGTKLTAVATFDNSEQNKSNPDPAREVPWGQQSWDEMFFGAVRFKEAGQMVGVAPAGE